MNSKPTYWQGCFPNRMDVVMSVAEAHRCGAYDLPESENDPRVKAGKIARGAFIRVRRIGTRGAARATTCARLKRMMRNDKEKWNLLDFNFVADIWEGDSPRGPPAGFCIFGMTTRRGPRSQRINAVCFHLSLSYVVAAKRRRGLGQMLSAAFEIWLSRCKVYGPRVRRGGVCLAFYSEYHTPGGQKCGEIVESILEALEDQCQMLPAALTGWNIADMTLEAGI